MIRTRGLSNLHLVVRDLERSLRFYRDLVGLAPLTHTSPSAAQDGSGFGFSGNARWDAWLLHDARGFTGPGLDLLEWQEPRPTGRPYAEANHLGIFRLCLTAPDLDAMHARLAAAGVPCLSAPVAVPIDPAAGLSVRFFCARDPDGTTVEFVERPGPLRLLHANVNCRDLARSAAWYRSLLGLEAIGRSSPGSVDGTGFALPGEVDWRAEFLAVPGQPEPFVIDLLEWRTPRPVGRPYASANCVGLFRLAFLVEDARACHAELVRQGVETSPPVWLEMGPEVPIPGLFAVFFRDPDGTCLELIQRPELAR